MSDRLTIEALLALLENDRELVDTMFRLGLLERRPELQPDEVEQVYVTRTLVRHLEVNWPGVEIILRMRRELVDTRRQVADLLELLAARTK
jgi:hypothetical protein